MRFTAVALAAGFLGAAGCAAAAPSRASPEPPAHRIVSLMPSFTEDLCAIGEGRDLVGVSVFSGDIPCARSLPVVNNYASVDVEKVLTLHPDLVVAIPAQRMAAASLTRAGIRVVFLRDDSYADIFTDIRDLGALTGRTRAAQAQILDLQRQTARLRAAERLAVRPRVFVVVQAQPLWTAGAGSYIATLIALAGGVDAASGLRVPYAQYSAEALLRLQPDVVIAGRDAGLPPLVGREPWRSLRAVARARVYYYDPNVLDRPDTRYNEALRWLIARFSSR